MRLSFFAIILNYLFIFIMLFMLIKLFILVNKECIISLGLQGVVYIIYFIIIMLFIALIIDLAEKEMYWKIR